MAGVVAAELRSLRRMGRTWLLAIVVVGVGALLYHTFGITHLHSGGIAPRFALPGVGAFTLLALLAGLVFLAFDARARDERAGLAETLDALPLSNLALLTGRWLATTLVGWLPVLVLATGLCVSGMVVARIPWPGGTVPEPVSLLTFALLDAPVAVALQAAAVAALVGLLRSKWLAVVASLVLLGLYLVLLFNTRLYLLPVLSPVTHLGLAGSEVLPRWPAAADFGVRAAALVVAAGLLTVAAGALRRVDATPPRRYGFLGVGLVAFGVACLGVLAWQAGAARDERLAWREAHRALAGAPRLDVERIAGRVRIEPGRRLAVRVDVTAAAPPAETLDVLRFSLNPGLRVRAAQVAGASAPFRHEHGLLAIEPRAPLSAGARVVVSIDAEGVPDARFGYLDSAADAMAETLLGSPLVLLGERASLFHPEFVALAASVRWLPSAGANYDAPADYFDLALEVQLPAGWLAAGAGRMEEDAGRVRFAPRVPIPEFALIAAPWERRTMTVVVGAAGGPDGVVGAAGGEQAVVCEILMHPKHMPQIDHVARFDPTAKKEAMLGGGWSWFSRKRAAAPRPRTAAPWRRPCATGCGSSWRATPRSRIRTKSSAWWRFPPPCAAIAAAR